MYDVNQYLSSELGRVLESTETVLAKAENDLKEAQEGRQQLEDTLEYAKTRHKEELDMLSGQLDESRREKESLRGLVIGSSARGVHEGRWGRATLSSVIRLLEREGTEVGRRAVSMLLEIKQAVEEREVKVEEDMKEFDVLKKRIKELEGVVEERKEGDLMQRVMEELEEWKAEAKKAREEASMVKKEERRQIREGEEVVLGRVLKELEEAKREKEEVSYELGLAVAECNSSEASLRHDVASLTEALTARELELLTLREERDSLMQEVISFKDETIRQLRVATANFTAIQDPR